MALFRKPPARVVLTAAAAPVLNPSDPLAKSKAPDAEYLYDLYTRLGPVHAAMQSKFMAASKITYFPARRTDADQDPEPVMDGPAMDAFERLRGPFGEFADFVAELGMHWEIPGEGYLVGQMVDGVEEWDVWSPVEYESYRKGSSRDVLDAPGDLQQGDVVIRSWRAHPMRRELPDSPLRSVLAQCEHYVLYQDMLTALGRSRLVAPLQVVPSEIDFPEQDPQGNPTSFGKWLMDAQSAAVTDTSNANRLTPITVESPAAYIDGWKQFDLARDIPEWVIQATESSLRQIAIGLDIPADILTGLADVNHWSAWLIDDSLRLNYVDPLILAVLDSLTRGYLLPLLKAQGVADADEFLFWRDYSDLTSRTVTAADAVALLDRGTITAEAARRTVGFTEADAPDEIPDDLPADYSARIESLGSLIRAGYDPESSITALGLPPIEHLGLLPVTVQRPEDVASIVEEPAAPTPDNTIPDTEPESTEVLIAAAAPSLAAIDQRLYTQLSEAGQAALDKALERAGAKVRSAVVGRHNARDAQLAALIADVEMMLIPQTVGRDNIARLQLTESELIPEGVFNRYGQRARDLLEQAQVETHQTVEKLTGSDTPQPEEPSWLDRAVDFLVAGLTALAVRRLFTPTLDPDPAETGEIGDTDVPADLVFDSMTIAGGGTPGQVTDRGLATGNLGETLVQASGFEIVDRQWRVGAPRVPFEPHHALNGIVFSSYTDPRLATPLSVSWLGVSFMFPGDHRGCVCITEPVIREVEAVA